ncbi:MAG: hypothetical protein ISR69_12155 [Gammaproteobacteria bacterium]|nr:hypothetical protein [Gammaproteobacteria bacterium]
MNITDAQVQMQSAYLFQQQLTERVEIEIRQAPINRQSTNDSFDISKQAIQAQSSQSSEKIAEDPLDELTVQLSILKKLVEYMTGKKLIFAKIPSHSKVTTDNQPTSQPPLNLETSVRIDIQKHYEEKEVSTFNTQALINTANGQSFNIDLSLTQSRSFSSTESLSIRTGQFKDPLVLNFFSNAAELSSVTYNFDIDADGIDDSVPVLSAHSAYLALDKNNDNSINDGSELFGSKSGNGFADLAQYDDDKNGWIDESDAIFSQLKIWSKTSTSELFMDLTDKNVGAIYLGHIATPFQLVDNNFQDTIGQIRSSGFYLSETGEAKTVQQIDLKI